MNEKNYQNVLNLIAKDLKVIVFTLDDICKNIEFVASVDTGCCGTPSAPEIARSEPCSDEGSATCSPAPQALRSPTESRKTALTKNSPKPRSTAPSVSTPAAMKLQQEAAKVEMLRAVTEMLRR